MPTTETPRDIPDTSNAPDIVVHQGVLMWIKDHIQHALENESLSLTRVACRNMVRQEIGDGCTDAKLIRTIFQMWNTSQLVGTVRTLDIEGVEHVRYLDSIALTGEGLTEALNNRNRVIAIKLDTVYKTVTSPVTARGLFDSSDTSYSFAFTPFLPELLRRYISPAKYQFLTHRPPLSIGVANAHSAVLPHIRPDHLLTPAHRLEVEADELRLMQGNQLMTRLSMLYLHAMSPFVLPAVTFPTRDPLIEKYFHTLGLGPEHMHVVPPRAITDRLGQFQIEQNTLWAISNGARGEEFRPAPEIDHVNSLSAETYILMAKLLFPSIFERGWGGLERDAMRLKKLLESNSHGFALRFHFMVLSCVLAGAYRAAEYGPNPSACGDNIRLCEHPAANGRLVAHLYRAVEAYGNAAAYGDNLAPIRLHEDLDLGRALTAVKDLKRRVASDAIYPLSEWTSDFTPRHNFRGPFMADQPSNEAVHLYPLLAFWFDRQRLTDNSGPFFHRLFPAIYH